MTMLLEARHDATAVLTMHQPARKNAMAMREEMIAALERIEADSSVRAVVITGSGGTFCSGGDISGMNAADFAEGRDAFLARRKPAFTGR